MSTDAQAIATADAPTLESAKTFEEFETVRTGKPDSAAAPKEEKAETAGESETPTKEAQEKKEEKPEAKPSRGIERKFGKMTRKISDLEDQNKTLQAQLDEARRGSQKPAEPDKPKQEAAKPADDNRPRMPRRADFYDQEDSDKAWEDAVEKYNEELSDWKLDQREKTRAKEDAERKAKEDQDKAAQTWDERLNDVRKAYPDYDEVLSEAEEAEVQISSVMYGAMQDSEIGAHIGYFLMKNPEEAERISKMTPLGQVRSIGKIEDKIESELKSKTPAKDDNKPKISKATEPIRTVSTTKTARNLALDDADIPFKEWEERRAALERR